MYNARTTRNTRGGGNNSPYVRNTQPFGQQQEQYQQKQQQQQEQQPPQILPHVATFVTQNVISKSNQNQSSQPLTPTPVTEILEVLPVQDGVQNENNVVKIENVEIAVEEVEKTEKKWPPKRKINKKEQKKRLNARMRRLVCPKSPLMVFSELHKDVPIKLVEQTINNFLVFTASIEIDGQVYTGDHVSKTQAKQKACENFLRVMLAKKMNERSEKKDELVSESVVEDNENETGTTSVKFKGPPQEDFPWPHFASLAMHNLIAHWELQPVKVAQEEAIIKAPPKVGGMKKFPENPLDYNPVQLIYQMTPGIKFIERTINVNNPPLFEVMCKLNGVNFMGQGSTKKAAKKECAIAAIKYIWNFDFHATQEK